MCASSRRGRGSSRSAIRRHAAYVVLSGSVRVTMIDEDNQEVTIDQPTHGGFFGFASMLDETPHQANAMAMEATVCVELDRHDIEILLQRKPMAGLDMLTILGRQIHASQKLVKLRASRNANEMIEEKMTFGERIADGVARFGGSWTLHHHVQRVAGGLHRDQRSAQGASRGTRIPSSC